MTRLRSAAGVFAPVVLAYLAAAWCLAALAWDGAGYVFNTMQSGAPEIAHHRYSDFPSLLAAAAASRLTDNARAVGVVYGIAVALVPVGALALCFGILRGPALAALRIWCVLGILWAAFPGQICMMSEATLAVQAFWPVAAFALAGCPTNFAGWIALVCAFVFFLHPTTAVLFAVASILCAGMAGQLPDRRRMLIPWAAAFAALAAARVVFSLLTATPYERGEFAFSANWNAYIGGIKGCPTWMLAVLYLLSACLLVRKGGLQKNAVPATLVIAFLGLAVFWAADPALWAGAISYRRFVLLAALPLLAAAAFHRRQMLRGAGRHPPSWIASAAAAVFAIAFVVQSLVWRADVVRFEQSLAQSRGPFLTAADIPWIRGRALDHWGSTPLSAILQGRTPRALYAEDARRVHDGAIEMFPGGWLQMNDGWFRLSNRSARTDDASR